MPTQQMFNRTTPPPGGGLDAPKTGPSLGTTATPGRLPDFSVPAPGMLDNLGGGSLNDGLSGGNFNTTQGPGASTEDVFGDNAGGFVGPEGAEVAPTVSASEDTTAADIAAAANAVRPPVSATIDKVNTDAFINSPINWVDGTDDFTMGTITDALNAQEQVTEGFYAGAFIPQGLADNINAFISSGQPLHAANLQLLMDQYLDSTSFPQILSDLVRASAVDGTPWSPEQVQRMIEKMMETPSALQFLSDFGFGGIQEFFDSIFGGIEDIGEFIFGGGDFRDETQNLIDAGFSENEASRLDVGGETVDDSGIGFGSNIGDLFGAGIANPIDNTDPLTRDPRADSRGMGGDEQNLEDFRDPGKVMSAPGEIIPGGSQFGHDSSGLEEDTLARHGAARDFLSEEAAARQAFAQRSMMDSLGASGQAVSGLLGNQSTQIALDVQKQLETGLSELEAQQRAELDRLREFDLARDSFTEDIRRFDMGFELSKEQVEIQWAELTQRAEMQEVGLEFQRLMQEAQNTHNEKMQKELINLQHDLMKAFEEFKRQNDLPNDDESALLWVSALAGPVLSAIGNIVGAVV